MRTRRVLPRMQHADLGWRLVLLVSCLPWMPLAASGQSPDVLTLNQKADGYRGIWYMNQPSNDEYVYKYSGGLGTYCAKHKPFAIYAPQVKKTFFCYGGTTKDSQRQLLHMVSYFDHQTQTVPRPTILLDKKTDDAHDNPVISIDDLGHIWIFSTSHGTSRPSYIHRSRRPFEVDEFDLVEATRDADGERKAIDNFSYMQVWHQTGIGFQAFFTKYGFPAKRTLCYMRSPDGVHWSSWQRLAAIDEGHYQVSGLGVHKAGTMFNYHPQGKGLNWRTNLYYMETSDQGESWQAVHGQELSLPLNQIRNSALVHDYQAEGLNVYLKDLRFDSLDHPLLLFITSPGYESGPKNNPRTWKLARWDGRQWSISDITTSDNNYDMGELWLLSENDWRVIAPTEVGPQPFNPGGEIAGWKSIDQGRSWQPWKQLTQHSSRNHTYVRRVLNAHPDFVAIWADGHGRQPSDSRLYFADIDGNVYVLPPQMSSERAEPELYSPIPQS
ncbi:MAG: BNR repeat-containing protein [bacterium]|nr:BNR repeat-containing protein [bacterium]